MLYFGCRLYKKGVKEYWLADFPFVFSTIQTYLSNTSMNSRLSGAVQNLPFIFSHTQKDAINCTIDYSLVNTQSCQSQKLLYIWQYRCTASILPVCARPGIPADLRSPVVYNLHDFSEKFLLRCPWNAACNLVSVVFLCFMRFDTIPTCLLVGQTCIARFSISFLK